MIIAQPCLKLSYTCNDFECMCVCVLAWILICKYLCCWGFGQLGTHCADEAIGRIVCTQAGICLALLLKLDVTE